MPILNIEDPKAYSLAVAIARITQEPLTDVVLHSLEDRLSALQGKNTPIQRYNATMEWLKRLPKEPVADTRTADEIVGYDEKGLPQ